MLDIV